MHRFAAMIALSLVAGCGASSPEPDSATQSPTPPAPADPAPEAASAEVLAVGRSAWDRGMCVMCHGADATGGQLGPDLTQGELHHTDGSVDSIVRLLRTGMTVDQYKNPDYKMPMPVAPVAESELVPLAEYVRSLRE